MRLPTLTLLLLAAIAAPAQADTFAVDRGDDPVTEGACTAAPNDCSLRDAIVKANETGALDTITLPPLGMVLGKALPGIQGPVTIAGAGARSSIVDGAGNVDTVLSTTGVTTLRDVTVTGALAEPASGEEGAVHSGGLLRLERVAIIDNRSTGLTTGGGSETEVVGSLIARNVGQGAGGIDNFSFLHMVSSTVTGNTGAPRGLSSFAAGGGVASIGFITVEHSTIARNRLAPGFSIVMAANLGIFASPVLEHGVVVRSSIIEGGGADGNCAGRVGSRGGNVGSDGTCGLALAGDRVADPRLAPLADNGGPTDTHALLDDSPAIGAAANCGDADQRGAVRLQAGCDSGAFESPLNSPLVAPGTRTPDTTRPRLRVRGLRKTVTRKAFNAGLKVRVSADEPIAAQLSLRVGSRRPLAARTLDLAAGARTVTLKPKRRLTGSRALRARLRVVAADVSANTSAKTIRFRVR